LLWDVEDSRLIKLSSVESELIKSIQKGLDNKNEIFNIMSRNWKNSDIINALSNLLKVGIIDKKPFVENNTVNQIELYTLQKISKSDVVHISMNVTHICNLDCVYCYGDKGSYGGPSVHMKQKIAKKAIDFLFSTSKSKNYRITFFGGEPLLNFKLIKYIVAYAKDKARKVGKNIYFGLTTNGTIINDEIINFFIKERIEVTVSFDGPEYIQDLNRRFKSKKERDTHKVIVNNLKSLLKHKDEFYIAIRVTMTKSTLISFDNVLEYFNEFGNIPVIYRLFEGNNNDPCLKISKKDWENINIKIGEHALEFESSIKNNINSKYGDLFIGFLKYINNPHKHFYRCTTSGSKYIGVSVDGKIYPCHRYIGNPEKAIGNIWDGINKNWLNELKSMNIYSLGNCAKCWLKYFCGGYCHHSWYNTIGNEYLNHCYFMKIIFEKAMHLYSNLYKYDNFKSLIDLYGSDYTVNSIGRNY
jgi:uncharacterized protein